MQLDLVLESLLKIGQTETFADIAHLPELCPYMSIIGLLHRHQDELVYYAEQLSTNNRIAFIKSVAVLEHQSKLSVGGVGSTTNLQYLLPITGHPGPQPPLVDPERSLLLDWIFQNTSSYWYYSNGARSIESYNRWKEAKAAQRASDLVKREEERQQRAIVRKAEATAKLYNAVRRGDTRAVQILLDHGADPRGLAPDGMSLLSIAERRGRASLITVLHNALATTPEQVSTTENLN